MPPEPRPGPGPPRGPEGTAAQMREFLRALSCPDGCMELRVWGATWDSQRRVVPGDQYARTLSGWYDNIDDLIVDALRISGVSVYVTLNPVHPDLLSRCRNKLGKNRNTTAAVDILRYERFLIDIDPIRRAGISATDAEVAAALRARDQILAEIPGLAAAAIWGCSGNGGYIAPRVILPNDAEGRALVLSLVQRISQVYSTPWVRVEVTPEITAANMLVTLAGTKKCKGSDTPERPHRTATIDGAGQEPRWDTLSWAAAPGLAGGPEARHGPPGAPGGRVRRAGRPTLPDPALVERRAAALLAGMQPAVEGQDGGGQTFAAAVALIHGFRLSPERAWPLLLAWNDTNCQPPWSERELRHKLDDAAKHTPREAPGWLLDADRHGYQAKNGEPPPPRPPAPEGTAAQGEDPAPVAWAPLDNPHRLAEAFLRERHWRGEDRTLRYWQDEFHSWDGSKYRVVSTKEVRATVAEFIGREFRNAYDADSDRHRMKVEAAKAVGKSDADARKAADEAVKPRLLPVTTNLVGHVVQAIAGEALLPIAEVDRSPSWIGFDPWDVADTLPTRNGLVHLPTLAECGHEAAVRPPTPLFFNHYAVDFDFDPDAPSPVQWLEFLDQLWPGDGGAILLLQEWMGYVLTADTSQHKILMLIGPPRSGKGTIIRIIRELVGGQNMAAPTLAMLATDFGLQPLLGKPVAVITDARISGRTDTAVVVERLLSISGEDPQTIDRKHREAANVKLPTRFMVVSNEIPRLQDMSGALSSRLLLLQLTRSFYGCEDTTLFTRLATELPGILLWAIRGRESLRGRGHFEPPESSRPLVRQVQSATSPMQSFLADCCKVDPTDEGCWEATQRLFSKWREWNLAHGRDKIGDDETFGRMLKACVPSAWKRRKTVDQFRLWGYQGVRLLGPAEYNDDEDDDAADHPQGETLPGFEAEGQ